MPEGASGKVVQTMSKKIAKFLEQLKKDTLFYHGSTMIGAYLIAGALNFFYQMFIGRILKPDEFGVFGSLFALFYIMGILGQGITISTAKFTSKLVGEGKEIGGFFKELFKRVSFLSLAIFLPLLAVAPLVASFLRIESALLVVIVALNFLFTLPLSVNMGFLQGLERFKLLGGYQIGQSLFKAICGMILVIAGYGVLGAIGALAVASFLILISSFLSLGSLFFAEVKQNPGFNFNPFYKYSFSSLLFSICFAVPANVDVIFVKAFFTEQEAGLYTATSVLGKVLIFLPIGVCTVLFPKVSRAHAENVSDAFLLKKALMYSVSLVGMLTFIYWFFPSHVIKLVFGLHYAGAFYLVRWYGLAMFFFSLCIVVLNYYLARTEVKFVRFFVGFTVLEIALIWVFHSTMIQIIWIVLGINLAFLLLTFSNFLYNVIKARV